MTRQEYYVINNYCNKCPLIKECREAGKDEPDGVWGGESKNARLQWAAWFAA